MKPHCSPYRFLLPSPLVAAAAVFAFLAAASTGTDVATASAAVVPPATTTRILVVVGPTNHPPGTHEIAAGGRVLRHCLEHLRNVPGVRADLAYTWPADEALLDAVQSVVFIGDTFPPQRMAGTAAILARLDRMMRRGCGIACVHYATGLWGQDVPADGEHPLLYWIGGYFANKSVARHPGVARVYAAAVITPAAPAHPISRGWGEFTIHDEPYTNNYFRPGDNQPGPAVTPLATALLPPENPRPETVAWCVERADGGRGFGIVMPHFYRNWARDDLRRFILNGIVWTAKREVPAGGVESASPRLADFAPVAIEPPVKAPTPAAKKK